jgi:MOSC domain-containing protein YiiM
MFEGTVISINITAVAEAPMESVDEVRAIPGRGLEGDRYFDHPRMEPKRELTLVEAEAVESFGSEFKIDFGLDGTRRNIVTRGVPLNHLVGKEFWVGDVKALGIQLCEPCATLQRLSHPKVLPGLLHRAGLRAQILTEGTIRVGAIVSEARP